jgi:ParB family chromosome partitioning protein
MGRSVEAENRVLKDRLRSFEDATVVEFLDPAQVRPSRFANRHERSFSGADFEALKAEIASAGRNVQPIKVRRLALADPQGGAGVKGEPARYEIAFGHRRHRACLELGLPVAAIVEELNDAQLFAEMDRENRERANLAPWEQGAMYKRALDAGLFPSLRKLASALGVQAGNASTAVQLASLPDEVVAAFESPLVLQYRWATQLQAALDRDRAGVLARAAELAALATRLPARQVLQRLVGDAKGAAKASGSLKEFSASGRCVGSLEKDASGAITVRLASGALDAARERKLGDFLTRLLAG